MKQFAPAYYSFLSVENDIDLIESDLLSFVENSDMREVYDSIKVKFTPWKAMSWKCQRHLKISLIFSLNIIVQNLYRCLVDLIMV